MKEITVQKNEANQRMTKLLHKYLNLAGDGFLYKMLRKKNITLNGKKADGTEMLKEGDVVTLWLSDETINKFSEHKVSRSNLKLDMIYETPDIVVFNKPQGVLSQKSVLSDDSVADYVIQYMMENDQITPKQLESFTPSICNRLDRNTSGIITCGKTLSGLQFLSEAFRTRTVEKYYKAIVRGTLTEEMHLNGYLLKDEKTNRVTIHSEPVGVPIETITEPLKSGSGMTVLKIRLMTGKTHQIRAHLASIGHPIIGDSKYGGKTSGIPYQLLHAWQLKLPDGTVITAPEPELFKETEERIYVS